MNKIFAVLIMILGAAVNILPQETSFFDAPLGGGIGYTPGWIIPRFDGINTDLKSFGVPGLPKSGFFTSGGAGFIYLGMLKNFRVGGFGFGGSRSTSANQNMSIIYLENSMGNGPEQLQAIYSLSGGGLSFEYTLPFVKDIAVSVGALIGRGSLSINLYRNYGNYDWNSLWINAQIFQYPGVSSTSLKNTYWLFSPTLNVEIPAYHMLCFRIGAGYHFTFGSKWTYDNDKDIINAPSDINGNSFFIQTGIFLGLFSF
jgi:hypothetical protein